MLPTSAPIPLKQLLAHAIHLQRLGRSAEAAQQLRRVLKLQPRHFDALLAMGQCCHAEGAHAEAARYIAAALKVESRSAQAHVSHGNALRELGRIDEAIAAYRRAVELEPTLALAHFNLATLLEAADRFDEAAEAAARAAHLDPRDADAVCGRANCLQRLARVDEALAQYDHALSLDPANADAVSNRAALLQRLGRLDEAVAGYQRALALRPDHLDAWLNLGHALRKSGRPAEACHAYGRALAARPGHLETLLHLGQTLLELDQTDEALACFSAAFTVDPRSNTARFGRGRALLAGGHYEQAVQLYQEIDAEQPGTDSVQNDLGIALMWAERYEESLRRFDSILARNPRRADALMGRANVLARQGRYQEALPLYDVAMQLEPEFAKNRWNRALCRLMLGDFAEGWRDFEYRLSDPAIAGPLRNLPAPRWSGQSEVRDRNLFLYAEQGLGDTIQFLRYVPMLVGAGARVIVEVPAPLASLCRRSVPQGVTVVEPGTPAPDFELHCPLMSLPHAFGTTLETVPATIPYLRAGPERVEVWRSRLGDARGPRIGLAWSGKARPNRRRSIPLDLMRPLETRGFELIGLQNEILESDLEALGLMPSLRYFGEAIGDFDDTAALATLCDLVISVDTSAAHLAGALGRPLWILLPLSPDYRWMLGREDSPWYPTARLLRQTVAGDWATVVGQVLERLQATF